MEPTFMSPRITPTGLLLLALLLTVSAGAKDLEVIDLVHMERQQDGTYLNSYEYAYGDWDNNRAVQINGRGLLVNLAGSKGGIGENRGLDFRKQSKARIEFIIGNRNRASSFVFTLEDKDGTNQSFDIPLQGQPVGVPLAARLDLTKPSRTNEPGAKPGLDLKRLKVWQIAGNWQSEPVEILVLRVLAAD
jgi:hypothetical protein